LAVSTDGAWEPWTRFFLSGVVDCARESLAFTDELLALRDRYQDAVRAARSSGLLAALIDQLFRVPSITIRQARDLLRVTPASASSNLQKLVALGIIVEVTGRTRDQMFVAREILGFLGRDLGARTVQ
jgi:Fic family protein